MLKRCEQGLERIALRPVHAPRVGNHWQSFRSSRLEHLMGRSRMLDHYGVDLVEPPVVFSCCVVCDEDRLRRAKNPTFVGAGESSFDPRVVVSCVNVEEHHEQRRLCRARGLVRADQENPIVAGR